MALRRMISNKIVSSARFLKMPVDTQCLYFHLNVQADDDGVVEAYTTMKMLGASEDNLKVLSSKGFVVVLNEDLVSHISDWTEHNQLRADRKVDSLYKPLLLQILPDITLLTPKPRADTFKATGQHMDDPWTTDGQPMDGRGKGSVVKDSVGKVSKGKKNFSPPSLEEVKQFVQEKQLGIDPTSFINFYESNGWKVGKNKMKDWKAAIRGWHSRILGDCKVTTKKPL